MSDLRERVSGFLRHRNIRLNTNLGQHFLVDADVLDVILATADVGPEDHVVEIGPGIGVLTSELVTRAKTVTAVELDDRMIPLLKNWLRNHSTKQPSNLTIIHGNALQTPLPSTPYKIVANIPYHITSPLLRHAFLESLVAPRTLTLLIQREVAEKICDEKHAGILTIMVKLFGEPQYVATVKPGAFLPQPAVDSAVLHIASYPKPLVDRPTIDRILKLLKTCFAGKRKMLRNTLGNLPEGMKLMEKVGIDPTRRPENLSVQEWIEIAREARD